MRADNVWKLVARAGETAGRPLSVPPRIFRYARGCKVSNDDPDTWALQHYLGHKNISHTVCTTNLAADLLETIWRD